MSAVSSFTLRVADEAGTRRLAADLAAVCAVGDVIALNGDLGMGKSAFARALIRALAGDPELEVPSPTFTLVQTYETARLPVAHFDLYRLSDPGELLEIGFDDALNTALSLIEWPERAEDELPANRLDITIADGDGPEGRVFHLTAPQESWGGRIAETLAVRALLTEAGLGEVTRSHVHGDASARSYERVSDGSRSAIVMKWPAWRAFMKRADGDRYEDIVHVTDSLEAFAAIGDTLRRRGFRTPVILGEDRERRLMLLEDLGSDAIVTDGVPDAARYVASAERLADLAAEPWPPIVQSDRGGRWTMPVYDLRALTTEVDLFADVYVPSLSRAPLAAEARAEWAQIWRELLHPFDDDQSHLVLRDYHSPNILWQDGAADPIGLIDFQDALLGSPAYDLASLLTDARVDLPGDLVAAMSAAYCARARHRDPSFDSEAFLARVTVLGAQRNAKILGRFVQYAERTGRTAHLRFVPRVRRNLENALVHPVLGRLKLWYERLDLPSS
ncbi:tRNA (adenosine(37)-N6)-threonylcarbamoyltransferase complex ATPase subunit type 1 TsaE [Oryzibacter oryziterrae]|uniref:tRNA (adenosine(37)-N6)-threonylcarbamoyltransferase complex ATPase subunit type 1 TsaE n=1 Tax=Oryzibacter oryziterrae TaxID=2766474 RepID=UPI001F02DEEC|nr:tRNA (adenosine(37)-N6)-threonylcarbamoyltransferase complex ATPase subunit type 1 TsaE [Oryzibacter oryziterrae]